MNYGQIYFADTANGPGCRTSLFVSGCTHHCKGCFNQPTWNFNYGQKYTKNIEQEIIDSLKPEYISGLSILGGEPMEPINQYSIYPLIKRIKKEIPHATIWIYSGYTLEELLDKNNTKCHTSITNDIFNFIDVLVDGKFILEKKDISLKFRGSSNQRIIDIPKTLKSKKIILSEYN